MYKKAANNALGVGFLLLLSAIIFIFYIPNVQAAECRDGKLYEKLSDGSEVEAGLCPDGKDVPASQNALLRDGIFGCNASKYANIGTLSAIGGIYVPVNDAAVTINTGYLVYKECVLDGVVSKIGEAARTELAGTIIRQLNTGRGGKPRYPVNYWGDLAELDDRTELTLVNGVNMQSIHPTFRDDIQRISVRNYLARRNSPQSAYASSYPGSASELNKIFAGNGTSPLSELQYLIQPGNDPASSYLLKNEFDAGARAAARYAQEQVWNWGNGFYAGTDNAENPFTEKILTPSYLISQGAAQAITSGFRCLEGSDEPSEVCAPMFNALATAAIDRGLSGLTQAQNGLPSYVNRMVSEASSAVRQEAVNAALNILLTSRQIELSYKKAKEGIAEVLTSAISRLRNAERACWELIVPKVREYANSQSKQVNVATSTEQFAQGVIGREISPIAELVAEDIKKSVSASQQIDQLIASVTNSASATNQRSALERLDTLVANGQLHTANDASNANKQLEDVTGSANTLVENTLRDWGDSTDPAVGWCNVNNSATIEMWFNKWKI